ncbi:MAG: hypothetical protein PVH63_04085 [Balneolaceae bacterium]|jgi:hypothetical protein
MPNPVLKYCSKIEKSYWDITLENICNKTGLPEIKKLLFLLPLLLQGCNPIHQLQKKFRPNPYALKIQAWKTGEFIQDGVTFALVKFQIDFKDTKTAFIQITYWNEEKEDWAWELAYTHGLVVVENQAVCRIMTNRAGMYRADILAVNRKWRSNHYFIFILK